jgi:Amino acid permease
MERAAAARAVEQTTTLALEEKSKLVKSLSTWCSSRSARSWPRHARNGGVQRRPGFTWLILLAIVFVLPYALLMAEVGSAFTQEGGPYEWTKLAFGRLQGAIAAVPYWVTNPLWVGGSPAFIATEAWSENLFNIGSVRPATASSRGCSSGSRSASRSSRCAAESGSRTSAQSCASSCSASSPSPRSSTRSTTASVASRSAT